MAGPEERRPLLVVLEDLALVRRGLVLQQGRDYWRIEEAAARTRREEKNAPDEVRSEITAHQFWWQEDSEGKVLVLYGTDERARVLAAEVGSSHVPKAKG